VSERDEPRGDPIAWWVELEVEPGQLGRFEALTGEMVEATRREPGVLSYARFVTDDGKFVQVYERYADSAAAVAHLQRFAAEFGARFQGMVKRKRFTVAGIPSNELRRLLDGFGAIYLKPLGPFAYWT
jgi:quinol monooxygenase YgiN